MFLCSIVLETFALGPLPLGLGFFGPWIIHPFPNKVLPSVIPLQEADSKAGYTDAVALLIGQSSFWRWIIITLHTYVLVCLSFACEIIPCCCLSGVLT